MSGASCAHRDAAAARASAKHSWRAGSDTACATSGAIPPRVVSWAWTEERYCCRFGSAASTISFAAIGSLACVSARPQLAMHRRICSGSAGSVGGSSIAHWLSGVWYWTKAAIAP